MNLLKVLFVFSFFAIYLMSQAGPFTMQAKQGDDTDLVLCLRELKDKEIGDGTSQAYLDNGPAEVELTDSDAGLNINTPKGHFHIIGHSCDYKADDNKNVYGRIGNILMSASGPSSGLGGPNNNGSKSTHEAISIVSACKKIAGENTQIQAAIIQIMKNYELIVGKGGNIEGPHK